MSLRFNITLHKRDIQLLYLIKDFFGVGNIRIKANSNYVYYNVDSIKDLIIIINHFEEYPLLTIKKTNYLQFVKVLNMIKEKKHLQIDKFEDVRKALELLNKNSNINEFSENICLNPWWLSGFFTGEGSFSFLTRRRKTKDGSIKIDYSLIVEISQSTLDINLLNSICNFWKVGKVYTSNTISRIRVNKLGDLNLLILEYFNKYPLLGYKLEQYLIWKQAVDIYYKYPEWTKERENKLTNILGKLSTLSKVR